MVGMIVINGTTPAGNAPRQIIVKRDPASGDTLIAIHSAAGNFMANARLDDDARRQLASALSSSDDTDGQVSS